MKLINNSEAKEYGKTVYGYNLINGEEVESESGGRFNSNNPSYLKDIVGSFPASTEKDVENACKAAQKAFETWKYTPAPVRGEIIGNIGVLLSKNKEVLAKV